MKHPLPLALLLFAALAGTAFAKPMPPASDEDALLSPSIVLAEFVSWSGTPDYMGGVSTQWRRLQAITGPELPAEFSVRWLFHDLSPCMPLEGWTFAPESMPVAGSRWLLFLQSRDTPDAAFRTYRGDCGRWPADAAGWLRVAKAAPAEVKTGSATLTASVSVTRHADGLLDVRPTVRREPAPGPAEETPCVTAVWLTDGAEARPLSVPPPEVEKGTPGLVRIADAPAAWKEGTTLAVLVRVSRAGGANVLLRAPDAGVAAGK